MIFFDLEFYVPPPERDEPQSKGTLVYNPARPSNILLGGHFIAQGFKDEQPRRQDAFWIWRFDNDESRLLAAIADFFQEEWANQQQENYKILNKRITDVVTCGFGIGRVDLPALYIRAQLLGVKAPPELFEIFFKTRIIDLSLVSCFLFPKERHLYPKTANEVASRLFPGSNWKGSGKEVWELYDQGNYEAIEQRCKQEVADILQIYHALQDNLPISNNCN